MANPAFKRVTDFPNEGFVDAAVCRWATQQGLADLVRPPTGGGPLEGYGRYPDLVAVRPDGRGLVVEVMGGKTAADVDFTEALGQLLKYMDAELADYAIAVPDIPAFHTLVALVPDRVRRLLRMSWLIVDASGQVREIPPPP